MKKLFEVCGEVVWKNNGSAPNVVYRVSADDVPSAIKKYSEFCKVEHDTKEKQQAGFLFQGVEISSVKFFCDYVE